MENKTKKVKVTKANFEHINLQSIAFKQLSDAKEAEAGYQFKSIIPAMAFSVFSIESLSNIYGSQLFPHWDHFESSSFIGKVVMISEFLKVNVDFSKEPWQTINQMKNFRNTLVHAKPNKFSVTHEIPERLPERLAPFPETKKTIMDFSSIETAESFQEAARQIGMIWLNNSSVLGLEVDLIGRPTYETLA